MSAVLAVIRALCVCLVLVGTGAAAFAQTILRDPDIEYSLDRLARPLMNAAGLSPGAVRILLIQDDRMNAFVVRGRTIFIHSGLMLRLGSAAELQAVIAHELAHITNGHLARRIGNAKAARRTQAAGLALGIASALAGQPQAGIGLTTGVQSSARRSFLSHTRAEEAAADNSGLRFMADAGVDPFATVRVLERFQGQEALSVGRQDAYVRSHPLTKDRLRAVKGLAAGLPVSKVDQSEADYWFQRAKGKLSAFIRSPSWTLRQVGASGGSEIDVLRRAVAYHRKPDPARARAEIDTLADMRPDDAFVHELRGQILLESRNFSAAVDAYQRGVDLAPRNGLMLGGLGRALLADEQYERALDVLERARARDQRDPRTLRELAVAYSKLGRHAEASLATAERYALLGRTADAATHANRAAGQLPVGSPGYRRAQDILDAAGGRQ